MAAMAETLRQTLLQVACRMCSEDCHMDWLARAVQLWEGTGGDPLGSICTSLGGQAVAHSVCMVTVGAGFLGRVRAAALG